MLTKKLQLLRSTTAICISMGVMMPVTIQASTPNISVPAATNHPTKSRLERGDSIAAGVKIETVSGAAETALVEYLTASGVQFYGAYWCAHCQKQKSLFGAAAAAKLPYIECAADGENSQRQLCKDKNIQMFPTWAIDGKFYPGTKDLKEIATMTGYKGSMDFKYHK
jgi:hypothetical protein